MKEIGVGTTFWWSDGDEQTAWIVVATGTIGGVEGVTAQCVTGGSDYEGSIKMFDMQTVYRSAALDQIFGGES